jgi:thioredoxin-dependent peroxiredoxin
MEINDKAPDFALANEEGQTVSLKDYRGKNLVLFFYPKANTPGWTLEACGFRDAFQKIQGAGAMVLGISADKPSAQKKFREKYDLPYSLLADEDKAVAKKFGVLKEKSMYGKEVPGHWPDDLRDQSWRQDRGNRQRGEAGRTRGGRVGGDDVKIAPESC